MTSRPGPKLDVSLHMADELRASLDSVSGSDGGSPRTDFDQSLSWKGSQESNRTWPRVSNTSKYHFATHPFRSSSLNKSRSCVLISSHPQRMDVCPFDGSRYCLKPFSASTVFAKPPPFDDTSRRESDTFRVSNSTGRESRPLDEAESEIEAGPDHFLDNIEDEHVNRLSTSTNVTVLERETRLKAHLGPRVTSGETYGLPLMGNVSSCRHNHHTVPGQQRHLEANMKRASSFSSLSNGRIRTSGPSSAANINTTFYKSKTDTFDFRMALEARYETYREQYLTSSPEQELITLNTAILNVRKWLRHRHGSLRELSTCDSNKLLDQAQRVERLIAEAKVQQEGVDVLLDRGQRFLAQRANIVLEVDLENLVFLWNSYVDELRQLYSSVYKFTKATSSVEDSKSGTSVFGDDSIVHHHSNELSTNGSSLNLYAAVEESEPTSHSLEHFDKEQVFIPEKQTIYDSDESVESVISCEFSKHVDGGCLTLEDLTTTNRPLEISDLSTEKPLNYCKVSKDIITVTEAGNSASVTTYNDSEDKPGVPNGTTNGVVSTSAFHQVVATMAESDSLEGVKMELSNSVKNVSCEDLNLKAKQASQQSLSQGLDWDRRSRGSSLSVGDHESLVASCEMIGLQTEELPLTGSPSEPKRRRVLLHAPSNVSSLSSRSESPLSLILDDSGSSTPTGSLTRSERRNELWKAIGSIDHFLLDKGIIEACKSTEKDLWCGNEDMVATPSVSFAEFLQQYKELTDWLNQVHKVTQREVTSLSEKYLNQSYHEEMLERSPRREFLNDYSRQLLHRNPNMAEQVTARMDRLNTQWSVVESTIGPKHGKHDMETMLQDLECDLNSLRRWLNAIEARLIPLTLHANWTDAELEERMVHHQALQKDIEAHNKVVNAVLKLSERLERDSSAFGCDGDRDSLQLVALNLEHRWHGIWLQSLEWQCRLEEAISRRKGIYQSGLDFSGFNLPVLDESLFNQCCPDVDERGLITLDDDSLLFIGRRDHSLDPSSPLSPDAALRHNFGLEIESDDYHSNRTSSSSLYANESSGLLLDFDSDGGLNATSEDGIAIHGSSTNSLSSISKPGSPLGKRRFPDTTAKCEGSPAKRGFSPSSFPCLGFSPISGVESELSSPSSPIIQISEPLSIKKALFDRSSGDSANISEAESKMGDSPPGPVGILHDPTPPSSDRERDPREVAPRVNKVESKDVGYSSESQSNDEVEMMRQQIEMECKFPGKCEVASDGPLGDKMLKIPTGIRPDFYYMTHVTDIDSTDKTTDNGDTTDSGGEKFKANPLVINGGEKPNFPTDDLLFAVKESFPENGSTQGLEDSWQFSVSDNPLEPSSEDAHDLSQDEKRVPLPNNIPLLSSPQPESMQPMHQLLDISESDSAPESKEKRSIRYLIDHAEELVRPQSPKKQGPSSPIKTVPPSTSFLLPSKQTQTDACSTVESSCDASGEDNSDHEDRRLKREEISTGTDDAEEKTLFDSVINLDSATESTMNISSEDTSAASAAPQISSVLDSPRLRKQTGQSSHRRAKKDRPWSVVGFQDLSSPKKTEYHQPSVAASESAINHLHCYTDSDSSPRAHPLMTHSSTFPRSSRPHNHRRAISVSDQTGVSDIKSAKRKLKFSPNPSNSNASTSSTLMSSISTYSYHDIPNATRDNTSTTFSPLGTKMSPGYLHSLSSDTSSGLKGQRKPRRTSHRLSTETRDVPVGCLSRSSATESYDSAEAESESESADEYLTARMEASTSEADDVHNVSGSMSDHSTWDNYLMVYPTASEDPGEELLAWEPQDDLEFDDDFKLPSNKSIVTDVMASKPKSKLKFNKQGVACEDSDSDLEDFHYILDQSEHQLKLADQSLRKKRKDPMGTCLHPNPAKYEEILMTYETNIKCLKTICKHLNTDDVTETDVQRVQDLMYQWEKLNAFATERHNQASALSNMRDQMSTMTRCIVEAEDYLPFERFTTARELNETIAMLKVKQKSLSEQKANLEMMEKELHYFNSQHPTICVDKYLAEIKRLAKSTALMADKVNEHLDNLENNRIVWLEYLDSQQELDTFLAADRERLYALITQREFGGKITKKDVLRELEILQSNLATYESKLEILEAMRARLTRVSNQEAQMSLLASLGDLRNQLFVVAQRCKAVYRDVGDDEELPMDSSSDLGKLAISAAALHDVWKSGTERSSKDVSSPGAEASLEGQTKSDELSLPLPLSKRCASWLRSLPVQVVALVLVAGLVCALDPDILDRLASFSLTLAPELRFINGPPAV